MKLTNLLCVSTDTTPRTKQRKHLSLLLFKTLITLILLSFIGNSYAQRQSKFEAFNPSDYPTNKYQIKLDSASFFQFKIEIRQVKNKEVTNSKSDFFCRAWLSVTQGTKIIKQIYFPSIEPVGSCGGLFIPDKQPVKDYFIISKLGDYDGKIFILDKTGKVTEKRGGPFSISKDQHYLFSDFYSDQSGLTVFDLRKNLVLFSDTIEPTRLAEWYFQDKKYFAEIWDAKANSVNHTQIAIFDIKTNKLAITKVDTNYTKQANKLATYNDNRKIKDCGCGK